MQKLTRRTTTVGALLLLAGAAVPVRRAAAADAVSLRLDWSLSGYHLPFYWAKEKGYFAAQNLDVEIKEGAGSGQTVNLIGGQQDDIGLADYMLMAAAEAKGMKLKGIYGLVQDGAWSVISNADKPIKEPKELIGKSIAMTADHKALFDLLLAVNKIPSDKVSTQVVSPATRNTVFANGNVDGFVSIMIGSPLDLVVRAKHGKGKPVYFMQFNDFGVSPLGQGLIVNDRTIAQRPELLKRFAAATTKALDDIVKKENADAAVDVAMRLSNTSEERRESVRLQWEETIPRLHTAATTGRPYGWMSDADWEKAVDILVKTGKIDKPFPPSQLYTNLFVPGS